jgi:hypothetical protein
VVSVINSGSNVLVHCSDGWDRTPQITSLAQLLLDPHYRTIEGFAILIEKDWCSFGHKFSERVAIGHPADEQFAPVFIQFLDCVFQIISQFPHAFEFNEKYLLAIMDHLFANTFGTFLCDSEQEKSQLMVREKTESLWTFLLAERSKYVSQTFDHNEFRKASVSSDTRIRSHANQALLVPNPQVIVFWTTFFMRFHMAFQAQAGIVAATSSALEQSYLSRISFLEEELERARMSSDEMNDKLTELADQLAKATEKCERLENEVQSLRDTKNV